MTVYFQIMDQIPCNCYQMTCFMSWLSFAAIWKWVHSDTQCRSRLNKRRVESSGGVDIRSAGRRYPVLFVASLFFLV